MFLSIQGMEDRIRDERLFTVCSLSPEMKGVMKKDLPGNAKVHLYHVGGCNPEEFLHPQLQDYSHISSCTSKTHFWPPQIPTSLVLNISKENESWNKSSSLPTQILSLAWLSLGVSKGNSHLNPSGNAPILMLQKRELQIRIKYSFIS